jgi:RNA polymerase sigma-70 factor, ECF subfamily
MAGCNDDQCLIAACRAGRTDAFGILVRRYQDRLYPTVLRLIGCAEDAHDLLQDAFLKAYEKLDSFHGESSFYTWVYRIAVNLALSDRRKRKTMWRLREDRRGEPLDTTDDPSRTDPSLPLEQAERDSLIQAALNDLAPDHRAVVVMKDLDGLRYEEIAETLGVPIGTVRSRLHRARNDLRERLRGVIEELPAPQASTDIAS